MSAGVEFSDLDWVALVVGMVVNIGLGFAWYSPMLPTGRLWMREMKMPRDFRPQPKQMAASLAYMLIGTFLLLFVLMHVFVAFRDAYDLDLAGEGYDLTLGDGLQGAFFTWLGFFVPLQLSSVAWEGRSWRLFGVNASYYLLALLVVGALFAWRL